MLRESADRFVSETYTADHRRRTANDPLGFSDDIWKQFADLGWLALPIAEAHGGLGGSAIEIGILMEAFGRGLVSEPYLSTVVIGASLISECGTEAQKQALLPKIADGSLYLAFAHSERQARFDLADVRTTAKKTPDGWRLDGHKTAVLDGNAAGQIIVLARVDDGSSKPGRLSLFLVPQGTRGLTLRDFPRLGGGRACNLELNGVQLPADCVCALGPPPAVSPFHSWMAWSEAMPPMPKSATFSWSLPSARVVSTFCGLRSRWTMPRAWAACMARASTSTSAAARRASQGVPSSWSARLPPAQNSSEK